ncbi:SDR family oxidoreductase [Frankia sp. AgB1.9]|uniref:SDR family NAD(P)-dependent oxidoreductase n=1 Tax=unclassified Frankia TaxID=2632575 RepID=UPI00193191C7|nr:MULTISPECIES: SDR family NAD(P)-dependent oxidoreductase [unclassified Frankia]MBL7493037.1 SDR family oxidoreductase [Frankia sp. AgW1.1]MBL7553448.1 SDR family oxidoreductase [Frankia sp. AgB1.9]MBL7619771.1 SDR family oxidoreductase [Frankia sp. AgB1.8]
MSGSYPDLASQVVVITGGSRGIGARTARSFAHQGAKVCVVGRDRDALASVVADVTSAGGAATSRVADVTDSVALAGLRDEVEARLGPVDVLAAFAGGQGFPVPSAALSPEQWRQILDSDLTSAFLTIQAFLPGMLERGRGSILTMSSAAGRQPSQANLAYGVANAGLVMLTRQLATELGPHGIRVNCIAPSSIRTEKVQARMPAEIQEQVAAAHPLRRLGSTDDVAQTALFLASDAAAWLTGVTIDVAGGRVTG